MNVRLECFQRATLIKRGYFIPAVEGRVVVPVVVLGVPIWPSLMSVLMIRSPGMLVAVPVERGGVSSGLAVVVLIHPGTPWKTNECGENVVATIPDGITL